MKKKIAMLLCATLFCASALTGCSNLDNAGTTASSRSAADSVVATESAAESETATDTADHSETAAESEAADTKASSENVTATEAAADISDTTVAGWQFVVEKLEKNKSLENVSVDLGYTGVETNDYVKEASDGNVYYLIKMQINKDGSTEAIDWASLKLTDSEEYDNAVELRTVDENQLVLTVRLARTSANSTGWTRLGVVASRQVQARMGPDVLLSDTNYRLSKALYLLN